MLHDYKNGCENIARTPNVFYTGIGQWQTGAKNRQKEKKKDKHAVLIVPALFCHTIVHVYSILPLY